VKQNVQIVYISRGGHCYSLSTLQTSYLNYCLFSRVIGCGICLFFFRMFLDYSFVLTDQLLIGSEEGSQTIKNYTSSKWKHPKPFLYPYLTSRLLLNCVFQSIVKLIPFLIAIRWLFAFLYILVLEPRYMTISMA